MKQDCLLNFIVHIRSIIMTFSGINHVLPEQLFKASIVVKILLIRNTSGIAWKA